MATLNLLKRTLRQKATATASLSTQPLSDSQYDAGFNILVQGLGRTTYQDFVLPQLSLLLDPLLNSRIGISVLEVGPGPESVLGCLPDYLRRMVKRYAAFEPNDLFATRLQDWLRSTSEKESPLPCLESPPEIHRIPFGLDSSKSVRTSFGTSGGTKKFDVILFCHSMYGMKPKHQFVKRALGLLVERPEGGMVVVFHRDENLHMDGLVCHRTAVFPTGAICVEDDDEVLDCFAHFIAGFVVRDVDSAKATRVEWRKVCRAFGRREKAHPNQLFFSAPDVMVAFTQHATTLQELTAQVRVVNGENGVKSREARVHHAASIIRPKEIRDVQDCVHWALKHGMSLTVVGGGHSGHCLRPSVVAVDMGAFDQVQILTAGDRETSSSDSGTLVVVGAGCTSGDIIRKTMAAGFTVPLGARPSVGAGLWLQGGIGHLARQHGLACDAIVGAVVVSVASGQILYVGGVPSQHQPAGAVQPEDGTDLLWGLRGAGTNFGIVISVTFKAYAAPAYSIQNWVVPLSDKHEARLWLNKFDGLVAKNLSRHCSIDAYLYYDTDKLRLGVSMFESSTTGLTPESPPPGREIFGPEDSSQTVDGVELFNTEMYMSEMHGGHGGGKTSSFKRCLFLKRIGAVDVADMLVAAVAARPSPSCYLHLLQGGGAISDVADDATAFGCRDWDFACVVTGVWPRDQDGTEIARAATQWVYNVVGDLLPLSIGGYGSDLGPDPRDVVLAAKAFGLNLPRLARLKHRFDPENVLAYACPLLKARWRQKLIILVTGDSCVGKDYCAECWASFLGSHTGLRARTVSISDWTKQEYAAATGADLKLLLEDRAYKEQHRPALSAYFQDQVRLQPRLPEQHFLNVVYKAGDVDVLFITGMRDEAPVAALSHLVPDSRLLEVNVQADRHTRRARQGGQSGVGDKCSDDSKGIESGKDSHDCPSFIFNNGTTGIEAAEQFAKYHLLPFFHEDLQRLADMVRPVPNHPRPGIDFRHVLGISQKPDGLRLCASLLQTHFTGDWAKVNVLACCETGGFLFASLLGAQVNVQLALIREAGKLPPPTFSAPKSPSHISSSASNDPREERIEMGRDAIPRGASVVVVDDVLATGKTLCAVLQLLGKAGIHADGVKVIVVAEFPAHRGRELLRQRAFGKTPVQSLLVFGGD